MEGNITLQVVADSAVDPKFGTGVIKVTPGHDPTDFEIGRRHNLPDPHRHRLRRQDDRSWPASTRGSTASRPASASWRTCRPSGSSTASSPTGTRSGVCYRCKTVVEPLVSKQWYVRTQAAGRARHQGGAQPARSRSSRAAGARRTSTGWRTSATGHLAPALVGPPHPGVVLRQGRQHARVAHRSHRVPAVRRRRCARTPTCSTRGSPPGSGRSPPSGWPEATPELKVFYPTSVLSPASTSCSSGWRGWRCSASSSWATCPFRHVYIHALSATPRARRCPSPRATWSTR